jgi:beta-mannanase
MDIKSKTKKINFNLRMNNKFSIKHLLIFALFFGLIGSYFVFRSFAGPTIASIQAEQMSLPANAKIVNDSSASGGKAIVLTANGTTSGTISLPTQATSLTVTAHGNKCRGTWPQFSLNVDNSKVLSGTASSNRWSKYSLTKNFTSGTHSLSISFNNDQNSNNCNGSLYLDVLTFYGPDSVPAITTVALSASPTSVNAGSSSILTWNSTNATSCNASGSWSGVQPLTGSVSTGALNSNSTYTLTCTGPSGTATARASVTVVQPTTGTTTPGSSIYWGAYLEGDETYGYYYGSTAPNGVAWSDAPWGNTGNTWDRFENNAGKKVSILHYGQPNPWTQTTFYGSVADIVTKRGAIPMIDMKSNDTPLADIAKGTYDNQIKTWATNVKNWGKPFFFRWNWEMNGTWFNYGAQAKNDPAAFVSSWRRMHDLVVGQGATNVTWVWCPNLEFDGSTKPLASLYPGDNYVDWTCLDGYNSGTTSKSFSDLYTSSYNTVLSIAPNKPMMIGEIGSYEYASGVKASWITDLLSSQLPKNFPKIKAVLWFNWRIDEGGYRPWPIESSSSSQAAFKNAIASPYYAANNYGNLPLLTKVKPLP